MNGRQRRFGFQLNRQSSAKTLRYLLVLLCVGIAVRTAVAFYQGHQIRGITAKSAERLQSQNDKAAEYLEAYSKEVEKLKEKGIFCIKKKKEPPMPKVTGILGDRALINGKWCKVGDEHAGAKVIKIEPTQVTILWKDKEKKLAPLLASVPGNANGKPKPKPKKKKSVTAKVEAEAPAEPVAAAPTEEDPLAWLGMEVSAGVRAFLLKLFEIMPADQVEAAKKEWKSLSDDQKQQRLDEVQQMVDSGQADMVLEQMKANQG